MSETSLEWVPGLAGGPYRRLGTPLRQTASKEMEVKRRSDRSVADQEAIERVLSGDTEAFSEVVERYKDRLFNVLVRILGDHHTAEDVLQEVFVKAFRALERFQRESQLYTWLYRIAVNAALSQRRKGRGRAPVLSLDQPREAGAPLQDPSVPGRGVPEEVEANEAAERVRHEIQNLEDDHRVILVLKDLEGMAYDEIAGVLGCPKGTVKSRLHRARMALRDRLKVE